MPFFKYEAQTNDGSCKSGVIEANSSFNACKKLENLGFTPISIFEKKKEILKSISFVFDRVRPEDLIFFTRQLRSIIKSGLPILTGLTSLEEQTENKKLKEIISAICRDIDQGKSFSSALSNHSSVFPEIYVNMIQAGEVSGKLQEILDRLIVMLEFNKKTSIQLKTALRYPLMVIVTLFVAFFFLATFVIPKFSKLFENSTMILPLPTRIMLGINFVIQNYWFYLLIGFSLFFFSIFFYIRSESGHIVWARYKLKIPIIGPLFSKIYLSRFTKILEALSQSGVSLVNALEIASSIIGNAYLSKKIMEISEKVSAGVGLLDTFKESKTFPPLLVSMISTGIEAGTMDEMLEEITDYYEKEIEYTVGRLSSYIEPILTIVLGIIVLLIALAIFLPWWDMIKVFKGG